MDDSRDVTDADVLTALKQQASRVEQDGPGRWLLSLRNGAAAHQGTARVKSGWLTVDFAPDRPAPGGGGCGCRFATAPPSIRARARLVSSRAG